MIQNTEKKDTEKLTEEQLDDVAGGKFEFDWEYFQHKAELNIKCPICGAEGTLESQSQGWIGHGDGTCTAEDTCICSNCGTMVGIRPELGQLFIAHYNRETMEYSEDIFPFDW